KFKDPKGRKLIKEAAAQFKVDPGLLAEHLATEPSFNPGETLAQYLNQPSIGSADLGIDDFGKDRAAMNRLVPGAKDLTSTPASDFNPESLGKRGQSSPKPQVNFTPQNAVKATAAYLKYKEAIARKSLGDSKFNSLPDQAKLQLNRLLVNPGDPRG